MTTPKTQLQEDDLKIPKDLRQEFEKNKISLNRDNAKCFEIFPTSLQNMSENASRINS